MEKCTKRRDSLEGQRLAGLVISYNVTLGEIFGTTFFSIIWHSAGDLITAAQSLIQIWASAPYLGVFIAS